MPIQVDTKVGVGAIGYVNNNTIGTDGLTLCVGVIAVFNGNKTCAHFSSGFGGPATSEKIEQAQNVTTEILRANFNVKSVWGYVNHTPRDWTASAIIDACTAYFNNGPNPNTRGHETIYINGDGNIISSFDNLEGVNAVENTMAEVNPPV